MLRPNCKDCKDRYLGCHDKCESFIEYRKEWKRIQEIKKKTVELEHSFYEITLHGKKRKR